MSIIQNASAKSKNVYWVALLLVVILAACQEAPVSDMNLFSHRTVPSDRLEQYKDTARTQLAIQQLPKKSQQVDSLLMMVDQLKGNDYEIALFYANQAYDLATEENWDLQRAISLYYIALMKRRLQTWGGGIEDALVDAEMSLTLFKRLDRKEWMVRVYDLMGAIHFRQYEADRPLKLAQARENFNQALALFEETNLVTADSIALKAEILHDLGTTYFIDNRDSAMILYEEALAGYESISQLNGVFRVKEDIAEQLTLRGNLKEAESLFLECIHFANDNKDKFILSQAYMHLSDLRILQYRKEETHVLFEEAINLLGKSAEFQEENKYLIHQRMGYAYNKKAFILYKKSQQLIDKDSIQFYFNLAYVYVDSTIANYKIAMDQAKEQGVISVMDILMNNIIKNCFDKELEKQGNCQDLLGENTANYLQKSYKSVVDLMTANLTTANQRIREMERLESDRQSAAKRKQLLSFSGIALLITGLIFLLFLQRAKQRKLQAQMEALRAQINPHFMSNSLNAIESLVNLGENKAASKYLIHFSRLSRRILNNSREPNTSLSNELQTLEHFMKLEQLRFRDKLNYQIDLSPAINANLVEVPAMILQPYVENAIWHGIKPMEDQGMLSIKVEREGKQLVCIIEDNGIGREKARQLKANSILTHQSHGMKITEERLNAIGKVKGAKVEIIDLHNDIEQAMGTKVIIRLPFKKIKEKIK